MPPHKGPDLREDRNVAKYDYVSFMEKMSLGENASNRNSSPVADRQRGSVVGSPVKHNGRSNGA